MADERTPDARPPVEFRLEGQNDDHMIHISLNPLHPARAPGPHLRRNVIHHAETGGLGDAGEMKIEPGIIDQHDEIPRFSLQHPPDCEHTLDQEPNGGQPDESHQVELRNPGDHGHPGCSHPGAADADQLDARVAGSNRFGQMSSVEISRGFTGDH